jgi:hypothetical protein
MKLEPGDVVRTVGKFDRFYAVVLRVVRDRQCKWYSLDECKDFDRCDKTLAELFWVAANRGEFGEPECSFVPNCFVVEGSVLSYCVGCQNEFRKVT